MYLAPNPAMFIPGLTRRGSSPLSRRKGGGGGGGGGGHGGGGGGRGSSSSGSKGSASSGGKVGPSLSISSGGKKMKASSSSQGGVPQSVIPAGHPFAGRTVGGGTRSQVYGTSNYGSGYPGQLGRGVQGRGFPFVFYPIVFSVPAGASGGYYLYREDEYGNADNKDRPGGPLRQTAFSSSSSTFHIVSDNTTVVSLQTYINTTCHGINGFSTSPIIPYNSSQLPYPRPEQAVQYYRASSVVLTLDGYNNTAVLQDDENVPPLPLPANVDTNLLNCINQTVGMYVPLVSIGTRAPFPPPTLLFILIAWIMLYSNWL